MFRVRSIKTGIAYIVYAVSNDSDKEPKFLILTGLNYWRWEKASQFMVE